MAAKKKTVENITPLDQIQSYLNDHKDEHLNGNDDTRGC